MAIKVLKNLLLVLTQITLLFTTLSIWVGLGIKEGIFLNAFSALDLLSSIGFLIASLMLSLGRFYIAINIENKDPNNLTLFILNYLILLLFLGGLSYGGYVFKEYIEFFRVLDMAADGCIGFLLIVFFYQTYRKLNTMIDRKFTI